LLGDFAAAAIIDFEFTTKDQTGLPVTFSGTPGISVYKDNSLTQSQAGVTLNTDWDGVTGLNHVRIDTSADGTFYAAGSNFSVVITAGTVSSVSVVGTVLDTFTLGLAASFARLGAPAGASVSADIAAIKTVVDAIKVKTDQLVFTVANKVDANVTAVTAGIIAAGSFASGALDAVWSTAARTLTAFSFSVTVGTNNDKTGYTLSATGVQAIWDALTSALTTVGSIGRRLADDIDTTISSRGTGTALDAAGVRSAVGLASANLDTQLGEIAADTDTIITNVAAIPTTPVLTSHFDTILGTPAVSVSADIAEANADLDELITSVAALPSLAQIGDEVWDEILSGHLGAGSTGEALNNAGAVGADPWLALLPGAYGPGSAGKIVGDNLDAKVSSAAPVPEGVTV
jgi:hypothetical protein